jgi:hypothetical protein
MYRSYKRLVDKKLPTKTTKRRKKTMGTPNN